ncbi:MAG TPA: hypothetical protein VNO32_52705 [Candidatus Acidoferrum sp.]|nr:hypothetical protein [Candidatus Acidoferrum sp.]
METNHEDLWVANRLATIESQWSPNLARGRALLHARLEGRRSHSWTWLAASVATAAVCIAVLAFPGTRAIAQEFWFRFILNRVDVVRLDLSKLPLHIQVTTNGLEQSVQNVDDAERKAGFRPYLPSPGTLDANPDITVTGPILVEQTIHVRDIESALGEVGASDVHVPAEWEGVQLRSEIGPMVAENYADNVRILQARPIELSIPSGFELEHFAAVAFRSIGVSSWESCAIAQKFAAHPSWLLDIPPQAVVNVQEVALGAGPALLIEDFDEKRTTVIWSTSERMYSVSSKNRELSMKIANALP